MNNQLVLKGNVGNISFVNVEGYSPFVVMSMYVTESLGLEENGNKKYKKTLFHTIGFGKTINKLNDLNIKRGDFIRLEASVNPNQKTPIKIRNARVIKSRIIS